MVVCSCCQLPGGATIVCFGFYRPSVVIPPDLRRAEAPRGPLERSPIRVRRYACCFTSRFGAVLLPQPKLLPKPIGGADGLLLAVLHRHDQRRAHAFLQAPPSPLSACPPTSSHQQALQYPQRSGCLGPANRVVVAEFHCGASTSMFITNRFVIALPSAFVRRPPHCATRCAVRRFVRRSRWAASTCPSGLHRCPVRRCRPSPGRPTPFDVVKTDLMLPRDLSRVKERCRQALIQL